MSENPDRGLRNGSAGHTIVNSGGTQIVPSEGHSGLTTVNAGGTQIISAREEGGEQKAAPTQQPGDKGPGGGSGGNGGGPAGGGKEQSGTRKVVVRGIFLLVLVAVAIGAFIYWWAGRNFISTDDAFTDGRSVTIAPRIAGKVIALDVSDNEYLKQGQVIVQLDPRELQAAVGKAEGTLLQDEAQLDQARIDLDKATVSYPADLLEAQGNLEAMQANYVNAQKTYSRQHSVAIAATTQQQIDAANAGLKQAEGEVKQAEARVQIAQLVSQNIGFARARVKQLLGQVRTAQAALDQANLNLSYATVRAPQDGWVTMRSVEVGDYLQAAQSIMDLVVPEVWVTANFKETQLTRMRPGQAVSIHVDAYPDLKLKGHVGSIQMGSGSRFSAFPAENATGNFVKIVQRVPVKIIIDSGLDPSQPLPLGLSVEPSVHVTQYVSHPVNGGLENEAPAKP